MLDAIRYVTDNGIKWRAMPADFPAWERAYAFFRRWRERGLVKEFHDRLRGRVREAEGRDREPTAAVIDSQSVKGAASVPAATRGYDGGKKINGRRRHVITDCLGLLLMVLVCAADVTDRQAAHVMLPRLRSRFRTITLVWADGGYTGRLVTWVKEKLHDGQAKRRREGVRGAAQTLGGGENAGVADAFAPSGAGLRDVARQQRGVHLLLGGHAHEPQPRPPGPAAEARAVPTGCRGVNSPDSDTASQLLSVRRLALDRTPSIFAGTNSSASPDVISFADTPSPPPGLDSTSSTIRR
ncbi:transposase [Streptomyces sp. MspMP-M5]|uniref:transposase n=1 Tax=Streptomyces sp. MspMP-M5 TaxID=1155718 RepID=UPI003B6367D2